MEDTYYKRNKQKVLEKVRLYQSTRKEHYKQKYKEWYAINKDVINERRRLKKASQPRMRKERVKPTPALDLLPLVQPDPTEQTVVVVPESAFTVTFE